MTITVGISWDIFLNKKVLNHILGVQSLHAVEIVLQDTEKSLGKEDFQTIKAHAREPLYSNSAVIMWWLQSTSAQNSAPCY